MTNRNDKDSNEDIGSFSTLRRYTVFVLLSLLVFVTVGNFIDDVFLGNKFRTDPMFFALVGGMITGLFSEAAFGAWRRRN